MYILLLGFFLQKLFKDVTILGDPRIWLPMLLLGIDSQGKLFLAATCNVVDGNEFLNLVASPAVFVQIHIHASYLLKLPQGLLKFLPVVDGVEVVSVAVFHLQSDHTSQPLHEVSLLFGDDDHIAGAK